MFNVCNMYMYMYSYTFYQNLVTKTSPYQGSLVPDNNPVKFDAVDLYVPEQCWRENEVEEDLVGIFSRHFFLPAHVCCELRKLGLP